MTDDKQTTPDLEPENPAEVIAEQDTVAQETPDEALHLLLEDARAKADEHWNQYLRANAELDNNRRRSRQDIENAHKYALEKFALELLPVRDSLEMGLAAAMNQQQNDAGDVVAKLCEGTELTLKMLVACMEKFNIQETNTDGQSFDPELHQAMLMQESSEHAANTIISVMQKGYQLNGRLLRPAMVVVAKTPATASADPASIDEQA